MYDVNHVQQQTDSQAKFQDQHNSLQTGLVNTYLVLVFAFAVCFAVFQPPSNKKSHNAALNK